MSASTVSDPVPNSSSSSAKAKKNKRKKKTGGGKSDTNKPDGTVNGVSLALEEEDVDDVDELEPSTAVAVDKPENQEEREEREEDSRTVKAMAATPNGTSEGTTEPSSLPVGEKSSDTTVGTASDTADRLEVLAKERDALLADVAEMRKSLETIQEKHSEELVELQEQLDETQAGKEHAETQYSNLLGRVNTIKSQLGERMKADAESLVQARAQIEELESENQSVKDSNNSLQYDLSHLSEEISGQAAEISTLRSRANLAQQNWIKERDELHQREAIAREEFDNVRQGMQDWEVLAMEERSLRESLTERVGELEDQLLSVREMYEKATSERDTQSLAVDGLHRALKDIQDARKKELRELVEHSQSQTEELRKQLQTAEEAAASSKSALEETRKNLERVSPFEKEVKEKNLLIGKLRHEAVILNDHLTKALRILKKGRPEDNVDRQIITNYFLHFLALDRSDPKKFESLQLIASLLSWTEEQRETAGLARPGGAFQVSSLRLPTPFRRAPSTPSLAALAENSSTSKESLADLWKDFLENEAREGLSTDSRRPSSTGTFTPAPSTPPTGATGNKGLGIL